MRLPLRSSNHICCAPSSFQPTTAITVVRIMYHHSVLEWRFWDNNDYTKPSITGYSESISLPSFLTLSTLAPSPRDWASHQLNFFLSIWQRTFPGGCTYRVWFIAQFTAHFSTWGRRRGIILQWKSWKPKKYCYFSIQRVVPVTRCSYGVTGLPSAGTQTSEMNNLGSCFFHEQCKHWSLDSNYLGCCSMSAVKIATEVSTACVCSSTAVRTHIYIYIYIYIYTGVLISP